MTGIATALQVPKLRDKPKVHIWALLHGSLHTCSSVAMHPQGLMDVQKALKRNQRALGHPTERLRTQSDTGETLGNIVQVSQPEHLSLTLLSPRIWYTGRHSRDVELSLPVVGCSQSYCAWCSAPCPIQTAQSQPSALGGGFAYILKCNRHAYSEGSFLKLSQAALVATRLHEGLPLLIQLTNNPMDFPASCTPSHILRYLMNRHCDRQSISRSRYVSSPEMLGNDCVSINGEILEILL